MNEPLEHQPKLISTYAFKDDRGSFIKIYDTALSIPEQFEVKQANFVENPVAGTLRGLHYQAGEHAEAKIFRCLKGKIQLAYIDLRKSSSTYLKSGSCLLEYPEEALYVPRGFATGYAVLHSDSLVLYLSDNHYVPGSERGIRWSDPILKIGWQISSPVVSSKDQAWPNFQK